MICNLISPFFFFLDEVPFKEHLDKTLELSKSNKLPVRICIKVIHRNLFVEIGPFLVHVASGPMLSI